MARPLRTRALVACRMIRIARVVLSSVRAVSLLAGMGFALIETLRLVAPANVPYVGPYTFLGLAIAALAAAVAMHAAEVGLSRFDRLRRLSRLDPRAVALSAAARPKVVDLDLYRRLAVRAGRRLRS